VRTTIETGRIRATGTKAAAGRDLPVPGRPAKHKCGRRFEDKSVNTSSTLDSLEERAPLLCTF